MLKLLRAILRAGVLGEGRVRPSVSGTPQGGVISRRFFYDLTADLLLTPDDQYDISDKSWKRRLFGRSVAKPNGPTGSRPGAAGAAAPRGGRTRA